MIALTAKNEWNVVKEEDYLIERVNAMYSTNYVGS